MIVPTALIRDVFEIETGSTPSTTIPEYWDNGMIKWITPLDLGKLNSTYINTTARNITESGLKNSSAYIVPSESIIISTRAPIGYIALLSEPMAFNQGCKALVPKSPYSIIPSFMYYQLLTKVREMNQLGSGSTFKEISKEKLGSIKIQLPPIHIQKQLSSILEKADSARDKRKQANQLTEQFLQSVFLEMFGDPVTNPKGWDNHELLEVCNKITDGTHDTPERVEIGVKFITGKNIKPFRFDFSDLEFVTLETHNEIYKRCNPVYGDILYTNIGVNVGTAVMNYLNEEFSMKNVALLKHERFVLDSRYLEHVLNNKTMKETILRRFSIGGAQSFLSLSNIKRINIPIPPIIVQNKFSALVEKVEILRTKQHESENELENLFNSLMQKAFKGELVS